MMQCVATVLIVLCGLLICSHAKDNQCPGDKASCPDDSTCCVLSNGSFGCCPIQNAVCCKDSVHCCPDGYTCDVINGICKMGRKLEPLLMESPTKLAINVPATEESAFGSKSFGPVCPEKKYQYGSFPLKYAFCCSDHKHSCPEGYTCDVEAGKCHKMAEHINKVENIPAVKTSIAWKCIKRLQTKEILQKSSALQTEMLAALNPANRICSDGTRCRYSETCCRKRRGGYACCVFPLAVCCPDLIRCCPRLTVCSFLNTCLGPGPSSLPKKVYF